MRSSLILDGVLTLIAVFRVVVGYSVDVAMTLKYPMALPGCAAACASSWCVLNCRLRSLLQIDLTDYFATGVDPMSTALGLPIRLMTGFYFLAVAPFMVVLAYALWTRKSFIRTPAIVFAVTMGTAMIALTLTNAFGTPPSTSIGWFLLYNVIDVVTPILILLRVVPQPLFVSNR